MNWTKESEVHLRTINEEWLEFSAKIFANIDPSSAQREEMRRAFFCGAHVMLTNAYNIGDESISEDDGVRYLEERLLECGEFFKGIARRPA
jgi:hypothetical protein